MSNAAVKTNKELYDPVRILQDPAFRIINSADELPTEKDANLACFYNPAHECHLVVKPKPKAGPGQVVVHVKATGICGSDVHFWKHGRIGATMIVESECGSGHESAGEVVEVGEGVSQWKIGDRVAIEAGVPCGDCEFCREGRYNACPDVVFFSTPPFHGTLTRYHLHPASWLHRIPETITWEEGALLEPLAVALAGIERSGLKLGDPLLICGAGPIGLVTLAAAHAAGATPIVITDIAQSRLDFAKTLVPSVQTVLIERGMDHLAAAAAVKKAAGGLDLKVALECTGVQSSIWTAIYSLRFGGKCFIIGVGREIQEMPFMHLSAYEIDVSLQYRYCNQYPKAIRLVAAGLIDLKSLVTHRFSLDNAVEAFKVAADPSSGAIKCQIID